MQRQLRHVHSNTIGDLENGQISVDLSKVKHWVDTRSMVTLANRSAKEMEGRWGRTEKKKERLKKRDF